MKMKNGLRFISLLLLLSFLFLTVKLDIAFAATVDLLQLTSSGNREDWPMIYKNTVYWSDGFGEIHGYDFKTTQESLLAKVGDQLPADFFAPTAYDGRYLVYNTYTEARGYNVHAYDMKRKKDIAITDEVGSNTATDYDEDTVVYIEGGACGKLHAYDLKRRRDTLITETACGPAKISGNIVVWGYAAPGGSNIYGYDLRRNRQFDVATGDGFQEAPDIYENTVVWIQYGDIEGRSDVYMKNLRRGTETLLHSSSEYNMSWPSISKSYVVWGKNTVPHVAGIEGVDLKTHEVFEIQEQGPHQNGNMSPVIRKYRSLDGLANG
ncbi:TPA: hypothetical protein DIS61_01015 [Patescibacteria group bacterium]|nr:MAG: hypothetical protein A2699_06060 [Candidatus Gottesmanbacteria bacterium RIFCSPHIGHO2_01_FULL_43_15]HCM37214.1 hypothetical protein [Patescibacteria group bacterium]